MGASASSNQQNIQVDQRTRMIYRGLYSNVSLTLSIQVIFGTVPLLSAYWIPTAGPYILMISSLLTIAASSLLRKYSMKYLSHQTVFRTIMLVISLFMFVFSIVSWASDYKHTHTHLYRNCVNSAQAYSQAPLDEKPTEVALWVLVYANESSAYCLISPYSLFGVVFGGILVPVLAIFHVVYFSIVTAHLHRYAGKIINGVLPSIELYNNDGNVPSRTAQMENEDPDFNIPSPYQPSAPSPSSFAPESSSYNPYNRTTWTESKIPFPSNFP